MSATVHAEIETEQAVLGGLLLHSDPRHVLAMSARGLTAEAFYFPAHRHVFRAMLSLADRASAVDTITVFAELDRLALRKDVTLDMVEGMTAWVPASGHVGEYADRVIELAQWRSWQQAAAAAWAAAERRDRQAFAQAQALFSTRASVRHNDTYTPERWAAILFGHFAAHPEDVAQEAIPLPFARLTDAMGGGVRPGEWVACSGPTSHGKSILADQILDGAARAGKQCHLYMTEMTALSRGMRYLARRTGISYMRQRRNDLTDAQRKTILDELGHMDYGCTVAADWDVDDIVRDALRARHDLVIVDLLHGFHYEDERGLDRLSKAMQRLARTSTTMDGHPGTAVVAITHLKEEGLVRGKVPRPGITSIKGGASIKQDADAVLFVWQHQDEGGTPNGDGEIWLAKGRSMEPCRVNVRLNPSRFRFELCAETLSASTGNGRAVALGQQEVPF